MHKNALIAHLMLEFSGNNSVDAAVTYIRRRDRDEHPAGSFDNGGRWYPDSSENLDTSCYRSPSRGWPYSYMHACRTAQHCAQLHEAEIGATRRIANRIDRACLIEDPQDATAWLTAEVKKILAHAALKAAQLET